MIIILFFHLFLLNFIFLTFCFSLLTFFLLFLLITPIYVVILSHLLSIFIFYLIPIDHNSFLQLICTNKNHSHVVNHLPIIHHILSHQPRYVFHDLIFYLVYTFLRIFYHYSNYIYQNHAYYSCTIILYMFFHLTIHNIPNKIKF